MTDNPTPQESLEERVARLVYAAMGKAEGDEPWPSFDDNKRYHDAGRGANAYYWEAIRIAPEILALRPSVDVGVDDAVVKALEVYDANLVTPDHQKSFEALKVAVNVADGYAPNDDAYDGPEVISFALRRKVALLSAEIERLRTGGFTARDGLQWVMKSDRDAAEARADAAEAEIERLRAPPAGEIGELVERLRAAAQHGVPIGQMANDNMFAEAAAALTRLSAELEGALADLAEVDDRLGKRRVQAQAAEAALAKATEALESFAHLARAGTEDIDDEAVISLTYDSTDLDPEVGGPNTLLGELFMRCFRRASTTLAALSAPHDPEVRS